MKKTLTAVSLVSMVALSACTVSRHPMPNPGNPERLIDVSNEVITLSLASKGAVSKLSDAVAKDAPARAELACSIKSPRCSQAKEIFERRNIPVKFATSDAANKVTMFYERVVTRDCNPRYVDNNHDIRSYNHPSFGCSITGNIVQQVSDKREFTNPSLLDFADGEKTGQNYSKYLIPTMPSNDEMKSSTGAPPK